MNIYQQEQIQALQMVRQHMDLVDTVENIADFDVKAQTREYLAFRSDAETFFKKWFERICSKNCYGSRVSACCTKDGILTFWADVVINAGQMEKGELDQLERTITDPENEYKCIYLTQKGCAWRIKPIICEMFLCAEAECSVFHENPEAETRWRELEERKKTFTWPDRLVLFEVLEKLFIDAGVDSPLMYMHKSPGLLRLIRQRKNAGG
jgi:hypothetical protein